MTGGEAGTTSGAIPGKPEGNFNRDLFDVADKQVSKGVRVGVSDARSIEQVLDKINNDVIKAGAKAKTSSYLAQKGLEFWWTLIGKTAEEIVEESQGNVDDIAYQSETNLRSINGSIIRSSKKEGILDAKVAKLSGDVKTFEYALNGYDLQIKEIGKILQAYQDGQNPCDTVTLKALPSEYLGMAPSRLDKAKAEIETKKRTAEIELTKLYASVATEGKRLDSTKVATRRLIGQYKRAMGTHVGALNRQTLLLPEGYLISIGTEAEISRTNEKLEQEIKKRDKVAGKLYEGIEEHLDILTGTYEPDFGNDDSIQNSKNSIDERFNEMGQEGEVHFESLRDIAHSYANKYGH